MTKLRLAGAALNQTPLDWPNNLGNIQQAIAQARTNKVDILCLPELCLTGYGCEDVFLSEWVYKKSEECLARILPWCEGIMVAVGMPFKHNDQFYNTTCIIADKKIIGLYAKQNMARDGVHYEPRWFTPWTSDEVHDISLLNQKCTIGDVIIAHKGVTIGFEICEDAWREERPACKLYEKGVALILNPSASHFAFGKTIDRETLVVSSSKNFNCTYVYANLLGNEAGRMIYDGEILIAKKGSLIAKNNWLSFHNVNLLFHDIDFGTDAPDGKAVSFPRDKNLEFVKAASLALFDYLRKSRSQGFVLSLSGGADSTTIAILISEMVKRGVEELGLRLFIEKTGLPAILQACLAMEPAAATNHIISQILHCAYQGTKNSSQDTLASAQALCEEIGATFSAWKIDEEVEAYTSTIEGVLKRPLTWEQDDIALQNIQARARSPIIWMLANINNALLLTTSNRSEGDVGYTTMDGDTSGSIAPIAAVDKHFIVNWLLWAEKALGYQSLRYVNNLKPSAELRPLARTQTDESDLMPYAILVEIEKLAIKGRKSPAEVFETLHGKNLASVALLKSYITKFFRLWSRNQWKRERIAPAFHLDDFNVDPRTWCRFPILSSGFEEELEALNA